MDVRRMDKEQVGDRHSARRRTRPGRVARLGLALAGVLLLAGASGHTPLAHAAGTVRNGTAASCTTAALNAALAGGGTVSSTAGAAP